MARPKKVVEELKEYSLSLKIVNDVYKGEGATAEEAISNFVGPTKVVKMGVMTFSKGDQSKSVNLTPFQIRTLNYKIKRPLILRNFTFGLK